MPSQKAKRPPFGRGGRATKPKKAVSLFGLTFALPILVWQLLSFVVPLFLLAALIIGTVNGLDLLRQGISWRAGGASLGMALLSAVLTSVLAFPCAYVLAFKCPTGLRRWFVIFLIIPFLTSYLLRVFAWQVFLDSESIVEGLPGILAGHLTLTLPLVVVLQVFALTKIDRSLIEAAHNLGCGSKNMLFQVILPMARGWLIIGTLVCFIVSFGDFMAPQYLRDSDAQTLSMAIVEALKSSQLWTQAAVVVAIATALLLIAGLAAFGIARGKKT